MPSHANLRSTGNKNVYIGNKLTKDVINCSDKFENNSVRLGPQSYLPSKNGNSYIRAGKEDGSVFIGDAFAKDVLIGPNNMTGKSVKVGDSFLPDAHGNIILRPLQGKEVIIGQKLASQIILGTKDPQDLAGKMIQIGGSFLPAPNGHAYLRSGGPEKNIYIGDTWAEAIHIGVSKELANKTIRIGNSTLLSKSGAVSIQTAAKCRLLSVGTDNKAELVLGHQTLGAKQGSVKIGPDSYLPNLDGDSIIRPGKEDGFVAIGDAFTSRIQIGPKTPLVRALLYTREGFTVQIGGKSYLPHKDGNSYIRPGAVGKAVIVGDVDASLVRIGSNDPKKTRKDVNYQIGPASHMPWRDGNTYIRPGAEGKNIFIGEGVEFESVAR